MSAKSRPARETGEMLTTAQAVAYLKLSETGIRRPERSLHRYRKLGRLRGVRVGYQFLWPRSELDRFLNAGLSSNGSSGTAK